MRIRLESIGCRLNAGEIDAMARRLAAAGHRSVGPGERAHLCILNTCTVTAIASKKSRQLIRQLRRSEPEASIVATGCEVEMSPDRSLAAGVDLVVGNANKDRLLDLVRDSGILREEDQEPEESTPFGPGESTRTRAFLKIQDGCDNRCAFCIVTIARGAGRSRPAKSVLDEVRSLCQLGYQEVVLSGVHLGSYGHELGDRRGLERLVRRILGETDIPRLRLSSLEPWDLARPFFKSFANPRLQPHLHLPLQSGCDATLRRMARRTSERDYSGLVAAIRAAVPDVAISTDVMVGFPGESEEEFARSLAFVEKMAFSRLHIFRYSRREETAAASMPGQVPGPIAAERSHRMHALGEKLERSFNARLVGRKLAVLWETSETFGDQLLWSGLTPNYVRVTATTTADVDLMNRITEA
ncbi:MAG: tRNA (N(6)-L-threonylcarbamoyladenosine(37)-C(2))-methylthiotransferase MtaB, partial [Acidobacteriota bacterium]